MPKVFSSTHVGTNRGGSSGKEGKGLERALARAVVRTAAVDGCGVMRGDVVFGLGRGVSVYVWQWCRFASSFKLL